MNPVKIVLGSTEVSLNDRFSALLKEQHADLQENEKATASLRNQRLAQEMARRPSVVAALRRPAIMNRWRGRMSVRERLGQQPMRAPRVMRSLQGQMRGGFKRAQGKVMGRMHDSGFLASVQQGQDCLNWTGPLRGRGVNGTGGSYWSVGQSQPHGDNWTSSRPLPSREQLDQQLDEYMSQSKSHLDAELDEYMAQVDVDETG